MAEVSFATFVWSVIIFGLPTFLFFCPILNTPLVDKLATWPVRENYWVAAHEFSGVPCEQLTFPVKAEGKTYQLSGAYYNHPKAKDIILISHGNGGSLTHLHRITQIAHMLEAKHSVFIYDYEGYGVSEGEPRYTSLARDGVAAFDFVKNDLGYNTNQIVLYGMSMGTGVSCEVARVREPKAIILDSAYTRAEDVAKWWFPLLKIYPSQLFPEPRYDNLAYLKGKHPPVLVITPLHDGTVPPEHGLTLAREGMPLITSVPMPNSGHTSVGIGDENLYDKSLRGFLARVDSYQLAPGSSPLIFAGKIGH
ncbi:MAG: alpha/beta hydrolase [Cyanobacteria bacterium SZAS LIN-3]|nr:alpha/beta hydrolase [Cyanobacteria bacterium SZAS LIN-3]MBS2005581.1 alpha/beta hydrolase [Cyanobacteria bacterium SZAS TMP-1]